MARNLLEALRGYWAANENEAKNFGSLLSEAMDNKEAVIGPQVPEEAKVSAPKPIESSQVK